MATAHLHAQVISRGSGHQAVAKAAYNARMALEDERYGQTHDFSRHRSRCVFEGIYAPKDAPDWTHDRAKLWNHVEAFEKHRRAELAREIELGLPHELTLEQNRWLLQDWIRENFTRKGLIADAAIHEPSRGGDQRNIHAHVMIVMRKLDGTEFVRAKERYSTFSEKQAAKEADLAAIRQSWEALANRHLERHGHDARIDMGRKEDGAPTVHLGRHASAMERQGRASELGDHNRAVEAENTRLKTLMREQARAAANENEPAADVDERTVEPDASLAEQQPDFIDASRNLAAAIRAFTEEDQTVQASRDLTAALRSFAKEDAWQAAGRKPEQVQARSQRAEGELSRLREFVRAGWEKVAALAQRMEAAWKTIRRRDDRPEREEPPQRSETNPLRLEPDTGPTSSASSLPLGCKNPVPPSMNDLDQGRSAESVTTGQRSSALPNASEKRKQAGPAREQSSGVSDEEQRRRRYAELLAEALAKQCRGPADTGPTFGM